MVASMTKRVDNAVFEMIEAAVNDEFEGGIKNGGLAEGWVGLCRLPDEEVFWETKFEFAHKLLEDEVIDKVVDAKAKIIAGEIDVPSGYD
jgi:basic membrane protein A